MEFAIYTVHAHPKADHLETVGEASKLAAVPPLWAAYEGLWITLGALLALYAAVAVFVPLAFGAVFFGTVLIAAFDGGSLHRLELRLRGWRKVGIVEAGSHEAAEELFVTGGPGVRL